MNIKEIANHVAIDTGASTVLHRKGVGILGYEFSEGELINFAEALIAEVQKQNEPVGYVDYGDRVEWYKDRPTAETDLYTFPPSTEPQWQPIETAPKDAAEILIYSEAYGVDVAQFYKGLWKTTAGQCEVEYPTHWLPLPEAPKGEQK